MDGQVIALGWRPRGRSCVARRHASLAWPGCKQRSQGVVEYALAVAVGAVVIIIGLNSLSPAQAGYFAGLGPGLASKPAAPVLSHSTSLALACTPSAPTAGTVLTCAANVQDTSASTQAGAANLTPPSPPTGTVNWTLAYVGGAPNSLSCGLGPISADTSRCSVSVVPPVPGTITVSAVYDPNTPVPSAFLASPNPPTPPLTLTIL